MEQILERMEKQNRRQLLFTKILCVLCAAVLVCSLVLVISVTGAVQPRMPWGSSLLRVLNRLNGG